MISRTVKITKHILSHKVTDNSDNTIMDISAGKFSALISQSFQLAWSYKLNFIMRYLTGVVTILMYFFLDIFLQQSGQAVIREGTYFTFVLIGGAFLRYLLQVSQAFSSNLREEMLIGTIEPLLVTATPTTLSVLGPSSWWLIQATTIVIGQLLLGALIGADFSQANWSSALVILIITLASFISYGIVSAAFTIVFKRSDPAILFISAIATVFSGVFYPIILFPPWLRIISYLLPFTYALRALRGALMGGASLVDLALDVAILLGFAVVLIPLSIWALRYAIRRMKETGELMHY
jgi:ABC-2 type transport system permease protein